MSLPKHIPVLFLPFLAAIALLQTARAETSSAWADPEVKAAYERALSMLQGGRRDPLLNGHLAWIHFCDKHEAFLQSLIKRNLLTRDAMNSSNTTEARGQHRHLLRFFLQNPRLPANPRAELQTQDQQLEKAYAEFFRRLGKADQILLRDAERAWIVYRDLDAAAAIAMRNSTAEGMAAKAEVTSIRVAQLKELMPPSVPQSTSAEAPPIAQDVPAVKNTLSAEDQKAVGKLKDEAQVLLRTFVEKKDDPFFAKSVSIKNVPEFSSDLVERVAALDSRFKTFTRRSDLVKIMEPASNEIAAIGFLSAWPQFTRQLKGGNIDEAGTGIEKALGRKPKDVNTEYLSLWAAAESWRGIFLKAAAEYQAHMKKGRSLAELGKNSDAIREYEAAFAIIETPSIPREIKKLKELSLGL